MCHVSSYTQEKKCHISCYTLIEKGMLALRFYCINDVLYVMSLHNSILASEEQLLSKSVVCKYLTIFLMPWDVNWLSHVWLEYAVSQVRLKWEH